MTIAYPVAAEGIFLHSRDGELIGRATDRLHASRIANCLTACAHLSDADLLLPVSSAARWDAEAERACKAEADRDRLLAALKAIQANPNDPRAHRGALDALAGR